MFRQVWTRHEPVSLFCEETGSRALVVSISCSALAEEPSQRLPHCFQHHGEDAQSGLA